MNRNLKMILTLGVLATAGYFLYKYIATDPHSCSPVIVTLTANMP